ncbi:hypothetical protein PV08_08967 [Exophiala spinifera]|uniref:Myb-like DNA-binding domain-containing protein n=1 Tax=Exophiala spinifera TaxID=91928 RepID=A0A0D1YFA1_9EURO|nr:uncharacterized protein PV08_08967 [Exophiala spinifera]KIW13776.1 hypothetical protein PV08_08967 [Exophiala spinifera]
MLKAHKNTRKATPDDQIRFLIACCKHSNYGRIDHAAVATDCGITSKGASAKRYERLLKAYSTPEGTCEVADPDDDADDDEVPMAALAHKRKATDDDLVEARSTKKQANNRQFMAPSTVKASNITAPDITRASLKSQVPPVEQRKTKTAAPVRLPNHLPARPPSPRPSSQRTTEHMLFPDIPPAYFAPMPSAHYPPPYTHLMPSFPPSRYDYFSPGRVPSPDVPRDFVRRYQEANSMLRGDDHDLDRHSSGELFKPVIGERYPIRLKPQAPPVQGHGAVDHQPKIPPPPQEVQPAPAKPMAEKEDFNSEL